jgi:hypothetical protein
VSFRIRGLCPELFSHLYGLSDQQLEAQCARRCIVDADSGFPDRIEMRDAGIGESVLLVNFVHQPANTPYRASHAIFVLEDAQAAFDRTGEVPLSMRTRVLSLRAFDADHMMVDADVVDGRDVEGLIGRLFADSRTAYVHAHYARRGCYAARIERA